MDVIPINPERRTQLEEFARRHGQDTAAVLDDALAVYLESERREHVETVTAVLEAHQSVQSGRTRPSNLFLEELRVKHGFPR